MKVTAQDTVPSLEIRRLFTELLRSNNKMAQLETPSAVSESIAGNLMPTDTSKVAQILRLLAAGSYQASYAKFDPVSFNGHVWGTDTTASAKSLPKAAVPSNEVSGLKVSIDTRWPRWSKQASFDEEFTATGFWPNQDLRPEWRPGNALLASMMQSDSYIELKEVSATLLAKSAPYKIGSINTMHYALQSNPPGKLVIKRRKAKDRQFFESAVEAVRINVLCRAFAMEFNDILLLHGRQAVDFVIASCFPDRSTRKKNRPWMLVEQYLP